MEKYTAPREISQLETVIKNETVAQQEQRVTDYLNIIELYASPRTRIPVNNHPVVNVYRHCQLLAIKGGMAYNGDDVITTTLKICFQLGVTTLVDDSHAHA